MLDLQDLYREVKGLANFLGLKDNEELCRNVANKCQFENMKRDKKGLENEFWTNVWVDKEPQFYRKGML